MTSLREAVDYFEQEWQLDGRPYLWDARRAIDSRPVMRDAARLLTDAETIQWCETHRNDGVPRLGRDPSTCWKAEFTKHLDPHDCRMVSARLLPSSLLAGLGET